MKKQLITLLFLTLLPLILFSQTKKKWRYKTVNISTTFNYYPSIEPYSTFGSYEQDNEDLILFFLTRTSGTFVIEEGDPLIIDKERTNHIPTQLLGVGASLQVINENNTFHELSLTKLSLIKSDYRIDYSTIDSTGQKILLYQYGETQRLAAFAFRYEFGRYFGRKKSAVKFGLSGSIEPSLYLYKRVPYFFDYSSKGNLFTLDVALIPMVAIQFSKKLSLDLKIIPNLLIADYGSIQVSNPYLIPKQAKGLRDYDLPEIDLAFSILLRYQIQKAEKRRKRRSKK